MERKMFSTLINNDLLKELKKFCIDLERPIIDILEEAMRGILKKYEEDQLKCMK
jgi:hypothetical protein